MGERCLQNTRFDDLVSMDLYVQRKEVYVCPSEF
jgi:hypothetical protein